ncbi:MAG: hypothetical protein LAO03_01660 [Acidobacteriia bacterium]|nr:hypothetical protein [Terriglobia bacterium]
MRAKRQQMVAMGFSDTARERQVQQEIETFLNALSSYPERFARDPYVSFEQHLFSIVASSHVLMGDGNCNLD